MIKIALAQIPSSSDAQANLETMMRLAAKAKAEHCAAICFPEASLTGYAPEQAHLLAIEDDHPLLQRLSLLARDSGIDILAGYMERCADKYHLTHGVFRSDGSRHAYRKTHLGEKEERFFTAGNSLDVFSLSCGLKAGVQLCVESHFPEITQTLSLKGAQIVFAPHAVPGTPEKRRTLWQTYIPARAYDNRVYVACCNMCDGDRFGGGCYGANPKGEVVCELFDQNAPFSIMDVDCQLLAHFHSGSHDLKARYYPKRRKPHLYL